MNPKCPQLDFIKAVSLVLLLAAGASAQVRVDAADQRVVGELRRVESLMAEQQWDEAVETIRRLDGNDRRRLYQIDKWRYVPVGQYTQALLSQLPEKALKRYRQQVDPAAKQDYLAGRFERVVREAYASSYADEALLALGEKALAAGDADRAYRLWEQILPPPKDTTTKDTNRTKPGWPVLPKSNLDPAAVRARLILASVLGGHLDRARAELARFAELHPEARGRFAGQDDADYAEVLQALLDEPREKGVRNLLPEQPGGGFAQKIPDTFFAWPTFAGNPTRNRTAERAVDASRIAWQHNLTPLRLSSPKLGYEHEPHRKDLRLTYHPAVRQDQIFITGEHAILGFDAKEGKPLWGSDGVIYREMKIEREETASDTTNEPNRLPEGTLGIPQFTTTLRDDRLYARLGTPLTNRAGMAIETEALGRDTIVCLDLKAEGRLVWRIEPDGKDWAFDGTPVVDGKNVYVAMRRGGIRPESHVACFDAAKGTMRWRQFVCSATTHSRRGQTPGSQAECTHNLLTLHSDSDTLYFNTNLGAVASLETETGSIRWLTLYPGGKGVRNHLPERPGGDFVQMIPDTFSARTLCPCVYDRGTLYVAPSDSAAIFAIDAFSGELIWSTGNQAADAVHLLGTLGDHLIASGNHLYWIATVGENRGQIVHRFPDGDPTATYGRGILAEGRIYWPTQSRLFIFEGKELAKTIDLVPLGLTGGNLTIVGKRLLITTDREITELE
ncbi:MAG: PQQ-binding-like beta-propeller repeat protein [Planctomycetia bacterium]|jgi:outer membrane protein assembly factor BamB